jgi:hypothetical protein
MIAVSVAPVGAHAFTGAEWSALREVCRSED